MSETEMQKIVQRVFGGKTQISPEVAELDPVVSFFAPILPTPRESGSEITTNKTNEPTKRDPIVEFLGPLVCRASDARKVDVLTRLSDLAKEARAATPGPARESKRLELVKAMRDEPLFQFVAPVTMLDDKVVRRSFTLTCDYFRCVAAVCRMLRLCSGRWVQLSEADKKDISATLADASTLIDACHDRVLSFLKLLEREVSLCPKSPWARHLRELDAVSTQLSKDLSLQLKVWLCANRQEE